MGSVFVAGLLLALVGVNLAHQRRERVEWGRLAETQRVALGQVLEELASLRAALVAAGAVERPPRLPPPPSPSPPTPPRLSPPPQTPRPGPKDDPPSTKPSRSAPRSVSTEDQIQRAMRRIERQARVPPEVQARWEQRLRALGAELGLPPEGEPSDTQLATLIREALRGRGRPQGRADECGAATAAAGGDAGIRGLPNRRADRPGRSEDRRRGGRGHAAPGRRPAGLPAARRRRPGRGARDRGGHDQGLEPPNHRGEAKPQPPPHRPPRPIADPLAGVTPERPKPSATRTAELFRKRSEEGKER